MRKTSGVILSDSEESVTVVRKAGKRPFSASVKDLYP